MPKHILSKSTFMYGCQCPKRLWLHKYRSDVRDDLYEAQTAIFQQGTDVGLLAQQLFPGGVDASPPTPYEFQQSVADTARYIREGQGVMYEAAFQYDGVLAALDILVKRNGKWYAYEVKSSTKAKDTFIRDAALQYYVITRSGIPLEDISILHLNSDYVRRGGLDVQALFTATSVKAEVLELQGYVEAQVAALKQVLQAKDEPGVEMGKHCHNPYDCDFIGYCSHDVEEEAPDHGEAVLDRGAIREFVEQLEYPLYFMDFETWMTAVPEYDGHWPYRQVPFQFSVHKLEHPAAEPEHHHYLAEGPHTPTREFAERLMLVLGEQGSIVVYNQAFEKTRLAELWDDHPHLQDEIEAVQERLVDLMVPFRRRHYYLPEMQGSYSIKYVLPALVPELSYEGLPIANGGDASSAFYNLSRVEDEAEREATRKALLEYCGLDTLAMVKVLERLKNV